MSQEAQESQATPSPWVRVWRSKIVEWALAYVAFGYALLHGVQMLRETFEWPLLVSRLTTFVLLLGAPVALTLAWYHGHRKRQRVSGAELAILIGLVLVAGTLLWWLARHSHDRSATAAARRPAATSEAAFAPPPHSIAVLPFANLSGDANQEYFSDGLTEELLNSLSRIEGLKVAARTSSFYFKGEHVELTTIARRLNVGAVLEGSVRRSANTVRVTAQLINGVTGFHLWSQTYDRDLGDVLKLQGEIADAVAAALKVTLLGETAARLEAGGTSVAGAFDAYLRAAKVHNTAHGLADEEAAVAAYTEALRLDPDYALAFAARSISLGECARQANGAAVESFFERAETDARKAIALAPQLAEGHLALAYILAERYLDFVRADEEYRRALALAPGNVRVLRNYASFAVWTGSTETGVEDARRAAALDPLNDASFDSLGLTLFYARRYPEALAAYRQELALAPAADHAAIQAMIGTIAYLHGELDEARALCELDASLIPSQLCLAMTYDKLGRKSDARNMLKSLQASGGEAGPYEYAAVYAQWGDTARALESLETALRVRDPDLIRIRTSPYLGPLRGEPRFQAIEQALRFPR